MQKNGSPTKRKNANNFKTIKDELMTIEYEKQIAGLNHKINKLKKVNDDMVTSSKTMVFDRKFVEMIEVGEVSNKNILERIMPKINILQTKELTEIVFESYKKLKTYFDIIHHYMSDVSKHMSDESTYMNEETTYELTQNVSDIKSTLKEYFKIKNGTKAGHSSLNLLSKSLLKKVPVPSLVEIHGKSNNLQAEVNSLSSQDCFENSGAVDNKNKKGAITPWSTNSVNSAIYQAMLSTSTKNNNFQIKSQTQKYQDLKSPRNNLKDSTIKINLKNKIPNEYQVKETKNGIKSFQTLTSLKKNDIVSPVNNRDLFNSQTPENNFTSLTKTGNIRHETIQDGRKNKGNAFYFSSNEIIKVPKLNPVNKGGISNTSPVKNYANVTQSLVIKQRNDKNTLNDNIFKNYSEVMNAQMKSPTRRQPLKLSTHKEQPNVYEFKNQASKEYPHNHVFYSNREKRAYNVDKKVLNITGNLDQIPEVKLGKYRSKSNRKITNIMETSEVYDNEPEQKHILNIQLNNHQKSNTTLKKEKSLQFLSQHNLIRQVFELK